MQAGAVGSDYEVQTHIPTLKFTEKKKINFFLRSKKYSVCEPSSSLPRKIKRIEETWKL